MNLGASLSKPIGIVIVSFKTTNRTVDYIRYELQKIRLPKKIVVVNNAYSPGDDREFTDSLDAWVGFNDEPVNKEKNVFVVQSHENLGFAKGNNLGAKFLIDHFQPEYLLFSNNDLEIISTDVVEKLIEKAAANPAIGAIGPRMIDQKGKSISPRYDRIGPLRYALWHILFPIRGSRILAACKLKTPGVQELTKREQEREGYCYWVVGSFMLVKTSVFISIDGFDLGTFLYSEEKILSERLKSKGYEMYFLPHASVLSIGEYTTSKYLRSIEKRKLVFESDIYYYRRYFKLNAGLSALLSLAGFLYLSVYLRLYRNSPSEHKTAQFRDGS